MSGYISMNEMQQRLEKLEKVVSEHLGEHRAAEDRQEFLNDRPATSSVLSEAEQRTGVADPIASGRFVVDLGNPEVVGVVASNGEPWSTYIDPKASPTGIREQVEPLEEEIKMIETIGGLSFKPGRRPYELVAELAASRGDALSKIDELEADNAKLRALVQEAWPHMQHKAGCRAISFANSMLSHAPISQRTCTCGFDKLRASLAKSLKEQGFVPTKQ